jgi:hypothetical protein
MTAYHVAAECYEAARDDKARCIFTAGRGTTLQAGERSWDRDPMWSLHFVSVYLILPASNRNYYQKQKIMLLGSRERPELS